MPRTASRSGNPFGDTFLLMRIFGTEPSLILVWRRKKNENTSANYQSNVPLGFHSRAGKIAKLGQTRCSVCLKNATRYSSRYSCIRSVIRR